MSAKETVKKDEKIKKTVKIKKEKKSTEIKKELFSPKIDKVTINIGVGEAGEKLKNAGKVLEKLTGQKPVETISKTTNKEWGIRKSMPIGCKVTLRGKKAEEFLKEALNIRKNQIEIYSFDNQGNLSFGIPDYTLFKNQKYDPEIGIFGMDICVTMKRNGYRVKHRRIAPRKLPQRHLVKREETIKFFTDKFGVEVLS